MGSLFRTADGAGVSEIILSGYSPLPPEEGKIYQSDADKAFRKTALGAEKTMPWRKVASLSRELKKLKEEGCKILALEQDDKSVPYDTILPKGSVALLIGNEVRGIDKKLLKHCDVILEIPMRGKKNSLNVSVAAGIALYQITSNIEVKV